MTPSVVTSAESPPAQGTDVVPAREILTLFNLLCLKHSPPQTRVCAAGGRNKEVRQAEIPPNNDQTPSLVHFSPMV